LAPELDKTGLRLNGEVVFVVSCTVAGFMLPDQEFSFLINSPRMSFITLQYYSSFSTSSE
jgi:hypothetical protein